MPSRNIVKEFVPESYYHIYMRGIEKRAIFLDEKDYAVFLGQLKKYLSGDSFNTDNRHEFKVFKNEIKLLAYCLMPNHVHLFVYQTPKTAITDLMRRINTGYVMYFNNRYNRVGGLFQGSYKASRIDEDAYLDHISRYIHLNPKDHVNWPYSSYQNYLGNKTSAWLNTSVILGLFDNDWQKYKEFIDDYRDNKAETALLKHQLANGADL